MGIKMVITQTELDNIPDNFEGSIQIWGGDFLKPIEINRCYDNSSVAAMGNSCIDVKTNIFVEAWNNSYVKAMGNSFVVAYDNSYVEAWDNSSVKARANSSVLACGNSFVEAWDNSFVKTRDNSFVEARDSSSVIVWDNSSVELSGCSQVRIMSNAANCKVLDNSDARIIHLFETVEDYAGFYNVQQDDESLIMYKAVHECDENKFIGDNDDSVVYVIGEKAAKEADLYTEENCNAGLYVSTLDLAVCLGVYWDDLAIIECKVPKDKIVVPNFSEGGVRTSELTVIREVPLRDCGVRGRLFAQMRGEYCCRALEELKLQGVVQGAMKRYEELAAKMLELGIDRELIEDVTGVTITNIGEKNKSFLMS